MHPGLPEQTRGTYAAIGHLVTVNYMKKFDKATLELMPVYHLVGDRRLKEKNLSNYWRYNTIGFFAPDVRYSLSSHPGRQVREFNEMVKQQHKAAIEIIFDIVYNHTAEAITRVRHCLFEV